MDNIPFVWLIERGYENVVAICPFCQKKIVFNRRSDLASYGTENDKRLSIFAGGKAMPSA
jgi:hypothetical protein